MALVKTDVENRLRETSRKKFQDPARIWTWDLLIAIGRHSYHWATGPRWQQSVGRWYFHRTLFKFRLCISLLDPGIFFRIILMFLSSLACFPHLPLPRPLVISLSWRASATVVHLAVLQQAQLSLTTPWEERYTVAGIWTRSYGNTIFLLTSNQKVPTSNPGWIPESLWNAIMALAMHRWKC